MNLSDNAYNTLNLLRYATWIDDDSDIEAACKELVEYFKQVKE